MNPKQNFFTVKKFLLAYMYYILNCPYLTMRLHDMNEYSEIMDLSLTWQQYFAYLPCPKAALLFHHNKGDIKLILEGNIHVYGDRIL